MRPLGNLPRVVALVYLTAAANLVTTQPQRRAPERTVVLTFDDAVASHRTIVAPLLKRYRFGATFCVTAAWMSDTRNFMSCADVRALDRMGFEIGNHTWNHVALHGEDAGPLADRETELVERELARVGVRRPTSFSWPGNHYGPEALQALRARGYRFARRGPSPGAMVPGPIGIGPLYEPGVHDPLVIPTSGLATPEWTAADFEAVVRRATGGRVAVLQFHGVPDNAHPSASVSPDRFREFLEVLRRGRYRVVALRDLARLADVEPTVPDPLARLRFER